MSDDFYSLFNKQAAPPANGAPALHIVPSAGTSSYAAAALRGEAQAVTDAAEGSRNHTLNKAWFNMGRHVGAGTIDADTVRATLAEAARATGLPDHEIEIVLRDGTTSALTAGAAVPRIPTALPDLPAVTVLEVPDLTHTEESAFWSSRDLLTHIHTFARARMVAPWAVLGVTLARIITATPHQVCLPPIIGSKASLNYFVGLVGPSGSGKGAAEAVAAEAVTVGYIESHNVGSGEGIAHGYKHRTKGELVWNDDRHAVLFSVPEIDSLAAQGDRKGATLMPQLRSGWTGEQLGFGYADPMKRIIVEAHQYRLCLVAGIQPLRAACLLDDADGGTPQRFLWMPATDLDAPDQEPAAPAPITWEPPHTSRISAVGGIKIDVCQTARDTIKEARRARNRGDGDALDGHALLAQLKTAAALGIADGRYSVTDEDWTLAEVILHKSAATRAAAAQALSAKAHETNHGRAEAEGKRAIIIAEKVADAAVKRVCVALIRRIGTRDEWPRGELRKTLASRDRPLFEEALTRVIETGQVIEEEGIHGGKYRLTDK